MGDVTVTTTISRDAADVLDAVISLDRVKGRRAGFTRELLETSLARIAREDPNVATLVRLRREHRAMRGAGAQTSLRLVAVNGRSV